MHNRRKRCSLLHFIFCSISKLFNWTFWSSFPLNTDKELVYVDSVCFGLKLIDTIPYLVDMGIRYSCPFLCVCVLIYSFYTSLIPCGKFESPYLGKATADATAERSPFQIQPCLNIILTF